jgi:hypothetical protein
MDPNPHIPPPIGLVPIEGPIESGNLRLLAAYATLGLPVVSSTGVAPTLPTLTSEEALAIITEGETQPPGPDFESEDLEEDHDDALGYDHLFPNYRA